MNHQPLKPEEYLEPNCPLCMETQVIPIPQTRVIEKLDEYLSRRDYSGAARHLDYWLREARAGLDQRGELLIWNEIIGLSRKTGDREKAFEAAANALSLVTALGYTGHISAATSYVNAATAYSAFGRDEEALALFEKARGIYESAVGVRSDLKGGLYNNMALTLVSLGRYEEAFEWYQKALDEMAASPNGHLEMAITYLNMADALLKQVGLQDGEKQISAWVEKAIGLLRDRGTAGEGYYAFVLEKCAPVLAFYGYFADSADMEKRARAIYERTEE